MKEFETAYKGKKIIVTGNTGFKGSWLALWLKCLDAEIYGISLPVDKNVTVTAITIPIIPKKLPCLEVSGDDKPLKARINKTPETR